MNKLADLIEKEVRDSLNMKFMDSMEYLGNGSIIAFADPKNGKFRNDLHGSLSAKLFVLSNCMDALRLEYNVTSEELIEFVGDAVRGFEHVDETR